MKVIGKNCLPLIGNDQSETDRQATTKKSRSDQINGEMESRGGRQVERGEMGQSFFGNLACCYSCLTVQQCRQFIRLNFAGPRS